MCHNKPISAECGNRASSRFVRNDALLAKKKYLLFKEALRIRFPERRTSISSPQR